MSGSIERLPGRLTPPDLSDWAEAGFPVLDKVPTETHGIHVEERLTDGTYVLQAQLPGIDPAKDVEITVAQGVLTLRAERSVETPDKRRSTRPYGHFTPLPAGAKDDEATAEYKHGVLTIRMPVPERKTGVISVPVREPLRAGTR
ncbi:Hsp20/alpha crystallin family protein [Streptomyces sp. NPDC003635]